MNWFKNMKIQSKLFLLIGVLISLMIFTNSLDISQLSSIENEYQAMVNGILRRLVLLSDATGDFTRLRFHNLSRLYAVASGTHSDVITETYKDFKQNINSFENNLNNYRFNLIADSSLNEHEREERLEILEDIYDMFVYGYAQYTREIDAAAERSDLTELSKLIIEGVPGGNKIADRLQELRVLTFQTAEVKIQEVNRFSASIKDTVRLITVGIIILSLFLSVFTAEVIKTPISNMRAAMAEISKGNLAYPIRSKYNDELGELSNRIGDMVDMILEMNKTMAVMDYLNCMICISDFDNNIVYVNKKMAEEYGVDRDCCSNKKCYNVIKGLDSPCPYCLSHHIMNQKDEYSSVNYDYFWDEKLGKWLGGSGTTIRWIDGTKVLLHYLVDETEKKEREEELRKAKLDAEAASISKSAFLATMSHEIRTPMNAILGITGMLLENGALPTDIKEGLGNIYNSGDLLLSIINDILDLSKIEAGKLELTPAVYQVASVIHDTVYLNKIKYEGKPVNFKLHVDVNVPSALFGDALRIRQILNNLLSNSFKYTDSGEIELSVTAEPDSNDETFEVLVFRVRDTGQGMTKEQVSKLFDEYSRFNSEINRTKEGTGLGMSITRNLIKMMNGKITVESEPGIGTVFVAYLPQGSVGADALGKEMTENLQQSHVNDSQLKKTHIVRDYMPYGSVLIVDDTEMNIYVAKGLMKPYGLTIDTAESGFEAIDKIKDGNVYDVVFMDHMMPKMDGIEATKIIRSLGYTRPIAALTANAVVGQADVFLSNGFDEFISKPIDIRQLNALLNKLVRDRHSPEEIAEARRQKTEAKTQDKIEKKEIISGFLHDLGEIDEINTEIGLSRFSGIEDMYQDTTQMFHKKIKPECEKMSSHLDNKDLKNFSVLIHAMKTSLSTIGAIRLSEAALKLETASKKEDNDFCRKNFPPLKEKLLSLYEQLSAIFPETKAESKKELGSADSLRENIQKAIEAANNLENDECEEALNNLLAYDFGEQTNTQLKKAMDALNDFKCGEVVKILEKI